MSRSLPRRREPIFGIMRPMDSRGNGNDAGLFKLRDYPLYPEITLRRPTQTPSWRRFSEGSNEVSLSLGEGFADEVAGFVGGGDGAIEGGIPHGINHRFEVFAGAVAQLFEVVAIQQGRSP